jgi:formate-dependent nitrite reductase membrane component NrfD
MHEITTTRANELIDPVLHVWGWEIAFYLFLGGLVAGSMIISGIFLWRKKETDYDCSCYLTPWLSLVFLSLGMLFLFLDIDYKSHVFRFYTTFQPTSPMSWGSWILILVYPVLMATALLQIPEPLRKLQWMRVVETRTRWITKFAPRWLSIANIVLGFMLGIYTGILLSAYVSRPFWNSSLLGILFLASGLSSAAALIHMIAKNVRERELLAKTDIGMLVFELWALGLILFSFFTSTTIHQNAAWLVFGGPYTAVFWIFVLMIGIIIPLFIQSMAVNHKIQHTPVAPILVLIGGFSLRALFVFAGQYSSWHLLMR